LHTLELKGWKTMEERAGSPVLLAVRLGWLTVEVFGRLRHYAQSRPGPEEQPGNALRRFDFSSRNLSEYDALLLAMDQLNRTATRLDPSLPTIPIPALDDADHVDLDTLQGVLDNWSTEVWIALSAEDDITGRGFTYGGSLADTYWHAGVLGPRGFGELLRPNRLEYLARRFDGIADHLPTYTARVLIYTLYKWRGAYEHLKTTDLAGKKQVLKRLESQAGVWHYLLFGERGAESYLSAEDRRFVNWVAGGITTASALVIVVLVWLVVMALSSAGRATTAALLGSPKELSAAQAVIVGDLVDWQKWSALLATISSVVVLIAGLVTRLSGWVIMLHNLVKDWLALRRIYRRAYRDWRA
jgi:hypothetical protein